MELGDLLPGNALRELAGHGEQLGQRLAHKGGAAAVNVLGGKLGATLGEAEEEGEGGLEHGDTTMLDAGAEQVATHAGDGLLDQGQQVGVTKQEMRM